MSEYWSDVNMWRCTDYKRAAQFWTLKFADQGQRETNQERVAAVNALEYERSNKNFRVIISEVVANNINTSYSQECSFADEVAVFFRREILV